MAAFTTTVFQRLGWPLVLGYLLAGLLVGPQLHWVHGVDAADVGTLAELGVILLMFFIGLEFSIGRLLRVGLGGVLIATFEVGCMLWLGVAIGRAFGFSLLSSFFLGGVVAIASTTIIAKVFDEQHIGGRLKDVVFATLVVEDLIAVLLLAAFNTLGKQGTADFQGVLVEAWHLAGFLAVLLIAGYAMVPWLMRWVVALNRPETTLVFSVGVCFVFAMVAQQFGYSAALGAFLAGSLVAESGEERRIEALVRPLRDMFAAVFFVAVGMSVAPRLILDNLALVATLTLAVLLVKPMAVSLAGFFCGLGVGKSVRVGMSLGQIGEFSFIIAGLGVASGAADPRLLALAVSVAAVTAFTTPFMVRAADATAQQIDRHLPGPIRTFAALYGSWVQSIVVASRERRGGKLKRWIGFLLLDTSLIIGLIWLAANGARRLRDWLDAETALATLSAELLVWGGVAVLAAPLLFGVLRAVRAIAGRMAASALPLPEDGGQRTEDRSKATADRPSAMASPAAAVDLAQAPRRVLSLTLESLMLLVFGLLTIALSAASLPTLPGFLALALLLLGNSLAFWRSAGQLHGHVQAGSLVVLEALRRQAPGSGAGSQAHALEQVREVLPGLGELLPVSLEAGSPAVGRCLREIGLLGRTGATVLAIRREDHSLAPDDPGLILQAGDTLVLAGSSEAVEAARESLLPA
ncbi:MAG: cation:proton antiporter [Gammaproteobacteria bacterium]